MKGPAETEAFARLMRELKERAGVSYGLLARRLHTSTSTLHRYCNGEAVPAEFAAVDRFARACGATGAEAVELHRAWLLADARRRSPVPGAPAGEDAAAAPVVAPGRVAEAPPEEVSDDPAPGAASGERPDTVRATEQVPEPEPASGPVPGRAAEPSAEEAGRRGVPGGVPEAVPNVVPEPVAVAEPVPEPLPVTESAPASGSESAPASGSESAPASGSESAPASGSESAPASGSESAPASGSESAPASGSESAPASG
ncbi:helix-turn-helix domain-containing protein, partial [Streptomyces sp. NPDC054854]